MAVRKRRAGRCSPGRNLADQHLQRVGLAGQVQVADPGRAPGELTYRRLGIAVLILRVATDGPKPQALVFFTEQLELGADFGPVLGVSITIDRRLKHAVARIQLGLGQTANTLVDLLVQRPADQHEHQQGDQGKHRAQTQGDGVQAIRQLKHRAAPARSPCRGWCAAACARTVRPAWRVSV